jgi:phage terminase large subunit-like protein
MTAALQLRSRLEVPSNASLIGWLIDNQPDFLEGLSQAELAKLSWDWEANARGNQLLPGGDWLLWLILAGRGFGKTRTGAETVRQWAGAGNDQFVNLIGATADDARDIMIEGESGILAVCPKNERPTYLPSKRRLDWPNGAKSLIFTADEPERLRGKQHHKLWADELGAWRYAEAWDQAVFGLRLGTKPQAVITTTPRPTPLMRRIIADAKTHVTRGSTYDNRANLAETFITELVKRYEGTRLGRQELEAEVLNDIDGALWTEAMIIAARGRLVPDDVRKIVVGVDPSGGGDEVGIVVCAELTAGRFAVLEDASCEAQPNVWGARVCEMFRKYKADAIVAEVNFGGNMVESVIRTVDPNVCVRTVRASRGKHVRAEPIAALYEQGRVIHDRIMPRLEAQMQDMSRTGWCGDGSPDHLDAMVWAMTDLTEPVENAGFLRMVQQDNAAREAAKAQAAQ